MAKQQQQKNFNNKGSQNNDRGGQQQRGGQQGSGIQAQSQQGQSQQGQSRGIQSQQGADKGSGDLISRVAPALNNVRDFVEGKPLRAAAIGAVLGGSIAGMFATEQGRSLMMSGFGYAKPMITKYARDFVSKNAGNAIDQALNS